MCNDDHTDWDVKIDTVLMGYRASSQASTKHSPYYMLFQQDMRLPIDVEMMAGARGPEDGMQEDVEETVQLLLEKRSQVFAKVEKNIHIAQQKQKETYDRKHLPKELPVGTEVMVENTAQLQRKGGKLDDVFRGVYVIHESLGKGLYTLRNQQGDILRKKVNIARLKEYKRREPSSPVVKEMPRPTEPSSPVVKEMPHPSGQPCEVLMTSTPVKPHIPRSTSPLLTPVQEAHDVLVVSDDDSVEVHRKKTHASTKAVDLDDIRKGRWLNDRVIHAAQLLMKGDDDLLPVGGLQDPLLGQTLSFAVQEGEAVQILHSGGNHWITVSTVGVTHPRVRIFDSLHTVLSKDTKQQIAALLATEEDEIIFEYANVQVS